MDRRAKPSWWRPWLLALALCVFALGYGAPTRMAAHAAHLHVSAAYDCPGPPGGDQKTGPKAFSACCIAHCVPAVPPASAPIASLPWTGRELAERPDEHHEGWAMPVPLPPPRATDRA